MNFFVVGLSIVVQDENEFPIKNMTITLSKNSYMRYMNTNDFGRVDFNDLCYGDDIILNIFGSSFATKSCETRHRFLTFFAGKNYKKYF